MDVKSLRFQSVILSLVTLMIFPTSDIIKEKRKTFVGKLCYNRTLSFRRLGEIKMENTLDAVIIVLRRSQRN